MKYKVTIHCVQGIDKGKKWYFVFSGTKTIVIGRLEGCHLELKDHKVSQSHCLLQIQGERLCVVDMASTHGTFVNGGSEKGAMPLENGDFLTLGETRLQIVISNSQKKTPKIEPVPVPEKDVDAVSPSDSAKESSEGQVCDTHSFSKSRDFPRKDPNFSTYLQLPQTPSDHSPTCSTAIMRPGAECPFCKNDMEKRIFISPWSCCENCQEMVRFIQETIVQELPENELCPGIRLESPDLWKVSPSGVTLRVKKGEEKGLLFVSRSDNLSISMAQMERFQKWIANNHPNLYPISQLRMFKKRMVALLAYEYGHFFALGKGEKIPFHQAVSIVSPIAKSLEFEQSWGHCGEVAMEDIFIEVTQRIFLVEYGPLRACLDPAIPFRPSCFNSPEVILGGPATPSSSVFSLASLLFRMVTGESVYQSRNSEGLKEEASSFSPPLDRIESPFLKNFFNAALDRDPSRRYPDLTLFLDVLAMARCAKIW